MLTGVDPVTIARESTPEGEVVLRKRGSIVELVVNGVFAMDSSEVRSEEALADVLGAHPGRVMVGGLGLGFTAARLLQLGAREIQIVELAAPLIEWAQAGVTEQLQRVAADPRVHLIHGDIADILRRERPGWDAIVLDVDNGPSFLIHQHNELLYGQTLLATALALLNPGGQLVIWCETASPDLEVSLKRVAAKRASVELIPVSVSRDGHDFDYALYRLIRR